MRQLSSHLIPVSLSCPLIFTLTIHNSYPFSTLIYPDFISKSQTPYMFLYGMQSTYHPVQTVGPDFTRRPVKYERFIRPMGLRYKRANVTHPELAVTVQLPIISVKKNPQNPLYTQLGVLTKGTIIEVNVSELGLVTAGGKIVWGRWAQITNNCENDGCVNA